MLLLLASAVAHAYCNPNQVVCRLETVVGIPGSTAIAHAEIQNNGTIACENTTVIWAPLQGSPSVTYVNSPPPTTSIQPGTKLEFTIELSVDPATVATPGNEVETYGYLVDPSFDCGWVTKDMCIVPSTENSSPGYWGSSLEQQPLHWWQGEVEPVTADFTGREVKEHQKVGGNNNDFCYLGAISGTPPTPWNEAHLTGLEAALTSGNAYEDTVGWLSTPLFWYRGDPASGNTTDYTPCYAILEQEMGMKCPTGTLPGGLKYYHYKTNILEYHNNDDCGPTPNDGVTSARDGHCVEKEW